MTAAIRWFAEPIGRATIYLLGTLGGAVIILGRILRALFPPRFDGHETWRQLDRVGVRSAPIVVVTALFVGAIMVIQTAFYVNKTGATSLLGYGVGFTVFAEIGPILSDSCSPGASAPTTRPSSARWS